MGKVTGISWTDHTFNPWWGCTKVSPGCDHCYAETFDHRVGGTHWGPGHPRRFFTDKHWNEVLVWNRRAKADGITRRVFCASMADIFDTEQISISEMDVARQRLWELIRNTENLVWQLLTKRPKMYRVMLPEDLMQSKRVWKGFSAEDQERWNERWELMKDLPGIRWCSYEPALGHLYVVGSPSVHPRPVDWVVCGGESGPEHRPMSEKWAHDLLLQCRTLGIKFFMKQMSASTPAWGNTLIPLHLLVNEFPGTIGG